MNSDVGVVAARMADRLPPDDVRRLAEVTLDGAAGLAIARQRSATGVLRGAVDEASRLLDQGAAPQLVAGALLGASCGVTQERGRQQVDVVWTGPHSSKSASRLTSAVVVDLIDSAREELLLVSFATQPEAAIAAALKSAVDRGIAITLLLERAGDNPGYRGHLDPFPTLPARRLSWPMAARPGGASMHAKVIVVDSTAALVGSANVTGHAMVKNLECGVLIRGGRAPAQIRAHVGSLVEPGELAVVT